MKSIFLDFYHRKSFSDVRQATWLLESLLTDGTFAPEKWNLFEPVNKPFGRESLLTAAECFANFENVQGRKATKDWSGTVLFKRNKVPKSSYFLEWHHFPKRPFNMSYFEVAAEWLKSRDRLNEFLRFSRNLYSAFDGFWFASIASDEEREHKRRIKWFRPDKAHSKGGYIIEEAPGIFLEKCIPGVFWGNYFGPHYVNWFGRKKFDALPCAHKVAMPDGGVFFTIADSPADWESSSARAMERKVKEHLGEPAFFDLPRLRKDVENAVASAEKVTDDLAVNLIRPCKVPDFPFGVQ